MTINICKKNYNLKSLEIKVDNLLSILFQIKEPTNRSLAFRSGCKSGVCGSCAVRVNGIEKLACKTTIKDKDIVEPLNNNPIIKDLIVDIDTRDDLLKTTHCFLDTKKQTIVTSKDEKNIDLLSSCILCNSCFSSCPVYAVNKDFIGPYALARVRRYSEDIKEDDKKTKIDLIQTNGVWDCTLCGNCSMVCPANIDIKNEIVQLRNKSAQFGYNDPNINTFDSGFDTNLNFGFDPNSF
jgi:fumarate reductase iron-sulfur subunit